MVEKQLWVRRLHINDYQSSCLWLYCAFNCIYLRGEKSKLMQFQWLQSWWNRSNVHQIWICSLTCFSPFAGLWLWSAERCQSLFVISVFRCLSAKKFYQNLFSASSHRALANATSLKWVCHSHCKSLLKWRVAKEYI